MSRQDRACCSSDRGGAVEMISFRLAVVAARSVLARLRSRHTWRQQKAALPHTVTELLVKMCRRVARTPEGADC